MDCDNCGHSLTVVVPAYNESATIGQAISSVLNVFRDKKHLEIIVCDDGSEDDTFETVQRLALGDPRVRIIKHQKNMGVGRTLEDLYASAKCDYVIPYAADGESDPENLRRLFLKHGGFELVQGFRDFKRYPSWFRNFVSFCFRFLVVVVFGVDTYDPGAMKLIRNDLIKRFKIVSRSSFREAEIVIRARKAGYKIGRAWTGYKYMRKQRSPFSSRMFREIFLALADLFILRLRL